MAVHIADYPQLKLLAWNRAQVADINEREALAIYETYWRFVDEPSMTESERALLQRLIRDFGAGVLNV